MTPDKTATEALERALRDRDYATVMEILPDLIESGEGALFTVDSLAEAIRTQYAPPITDERIRHLAAALIKEARSE